MSLPHSALDAAVQTGLSSLLDAGYMYRGVAERDGGSTIGPYLEARFENRPIQRTVLVQYFPESESGTENLGVAFKRYRHETIPMKGLLKHLGNRDRELNEARLDRYLGTTEQRLSACMAAINSILQGCAYALINGTEWPDVPFDWQGLK